MSVADDGTKTKTAVADDDDDGVLNVKLGQTILLEANIKGDIDVETGFKYCKVRCERMPRTEMEQIAPYATLSVLVMLLMHNRCRGDPLLFFLP